MANEKINSTPENSKTPRETDIDKIVHRHMQNKDDIITEEDIKYAKIDYTTDAPTVGAEAEAKLDEDEDKEPNDTPLTSWDVTT